MGHSDMYGQAAKGGLDVGGATLFERFLDRDAQQRLLAGIRDVAERAPLFHPETRWGRKMSVRMTSAGSVGWISDRRGYRYADTHPSGVPWPPIPGPVLDIWRSVAGVARDPDCCLVNHYDASARMGMHQDRDEASFDWPVVSISLGDDALFRIGGTERGGSTVSHWLKSGDVLVLGGAARLAYHGIDRVRGGSSDLLAGGGRINLTLRVAR